MYRDIFYDPRKKVVHLWTWNEDGERVKIEEPFRPYLFIESGQHNDAVSVYGTNLKKIIFPSQFDRRRYVEQSGTSRLFYNLKPDQQYLIDRFGQLNNDPDFSKFPLRIYFLDIEVFSPDMFPDAKDPQAPINLITIYDTLEDRYHTFGLEKDYVPKLPNVKYIKCDSEVELLRTFLRFWQKNYPDVVSGWNSEGFDIPYIINRITRILGEEYANKLSPVGSIFYRESIVQKYGRDQGRWHIHGMNCIDYMEAYKWGSRSERESYSLNYISQVELGEGKLNINATNLAHLSETDWENFVDYNIQDVALLVKLEEKLRFLKIIRMIAYMGLARFEVSMGKIAIVTGVTALEALKQDKIISTFKNDNQGNYAGGFVKEIEPGLREHIITFDANSLYPNTLISLNLSPETKIGKIVSKSNDKVEIKLVNGKFHTLTVDNFYQFIKKDHIAISKARVLYSQKKKGIMPTLVDNIYSKRVESKTNMLKSQKSLTHCKEGSDRYKELKRIIETEDIMQYTLKILLNSIYGVFANRHSPFYDIDNASSITLTGQAVIKKASQILDEYAKETYNAIGEVTHYNDTDSTHCSLKPILDSKDIPFFNEDGSLSPKIYALAKELQEHLNIKIAEWAKTALNSEDSRFFFKREAICPVGLYQSKKHYILHIRDKGEDDPIPCDKIKYVGVEIAKSTMSDEVKSLIKRVVEAIIYTKENKQTNEQYKKIYEEFQNLPIEALAFRTSISDYDKSANQSEGFTTAKGTSVHVKAAIYYNRLLEEFGISTKYDPIRSGMKIKWFYCAQNKYNISNCAFVDKFPDELKETVKPDYEKMFEKLVTPAISRLYKCVQWRLKNLKNEEAVDILDFFASDDVD